MKKILLFLLLIPQLCAAQTVTTLIDFEDGPRGNPDYPCPGNTDCFFGTGPRTINNVAISATHGCPSIGTRLKMTSFVSVETGDVLGGGIAVHYPFRAHYKYKITTAGGGLDNVILQLQMTNSPIYASNLCTFRNNAVDIISTTNPSATFTSINSSVEFIPNQCYDFLWLSVLPEVGTTGGGLQMHTLKIEQTALYTIEGPTDVCSSGSFDLKLNGQPYPGTVTWAANNIHPQTGTIVNSTTSGNQLTLSKAADGAIQLNAFASICGIPTVVAQKNINVGTPSPYFVYKLWEQCIGGSDWEYNLQAQPALQNVEYIWSLFGYEYPATSSPNFYGYEFPASCINIDLKIRTSCGTSTPLSAITNGNPATFCPPCGGYRFTISPNPSHDYIIIQQANKIKNTFYIKAIMIIDKDGNTRKTLRTAGKQTSLRVSISGLEPGVYNVRLFDGKDWSVQQFIKL